MLRDMDSPTLERAHVLLLYVLIALLMLATIWTPIREKLRAVKAVVPITTDWA
jgi:hypothetical protein